MCKVKFVKCNALGPGFPDEKWEGYYTCDGKRFASRTKYTGYNSEKKEKPYRVSYDVYNARKAWNDAGKPDSWRPYMFTKSFRTQSEAKKHAEDMAEFFASVGLI